MRIGIACLLMSMALPAPVAGSEPAALPPIDQRLLLSYLANPDTLTLVDARSPEEYAVGHVAGAINLPLDQLNPEHRDLPPRHDRQILVYCKTGLRAAQVAAKLKAFGYSDVQVLPARQLMFQDELVVFNCGV